MNPAGADTVRYICLGALAVMSVAMYGGSIWTRAREWRRGRRVELWSDDESRVRALRDAGASPDVADALARQGKINAIKAYRIETGVGLAEAKRAVDALESALYRYEPWNARPTP